MRGPGARSESRGFNCFNLQSSFTTQQRILLRSLQISLPHRLHKSTSKMSRGPPLTTSASYCIKHGHRLVPLCEDPTMPTCPRAQIRRSLLIIESFRLEDTPHSMYVLLRSKRCLEASTALLLPRIIDDNAHRLALCGDAPAYSFKGHTPRNLRVRVLHLRDFIYILQR